MNNNYFESKYYILYQCQLTKKVKFTNNDKTKIKQIYM